METDIFYFNRMQARAVEIELGHNYKFSSM